MTIEDKIQEAIQECNTSIDHYTQKIRIIADDPRQKSLLNILYEGKRVEQAKIKLLKRLLK